MTIIKIMNFPILPYPLELSQLYLQSWIYLLASIHPTIANSPSSSCHRSPHNICLPCHGSFCSLHPYPQPEVDQTGFPISKLKYKLARQLQHQETKTKCVHKFIRHETSNGSLAKGSWHCIAWIDGLGVCSPPKKGCQLIVLCCLITASVLERHFMDSDRMRCITLLESLSGEHYINIALPQKIKVSWRRQVS